MPPDFQSRRIDGGALLVSGFGARAQCLDAGFLGDGDRRTRGTARFMTSPSTSFDEVRRATVMAAPPQVHGMSELLFYDVIVL